VCAKGYGALSLWHLGYPDQAAQSAVEAVTLGEGLSHPPSLAHALYWAALVHQFRRDPRAVHEYAERLRALGTEHRLALYAAIGDIMRGWAGCYQGRVESGLREVRSGMEAYAALKVRLFSPYFTALLGEACYLTSEIEPALVAVEEAMHLSDRLAERWCQSAIWQLKSQILMSSAADNREEAENCLQEALQLARRQEAKSAELRAAASLARLWGEQGRRTEARDLLAPVYGWFTEGFDTADLKEAKALLFELA